MRRLAIIFGLLWLSTITRAQSVTRTFVTSIPAADISEFQSGTGISQHRLSWNVGPGTVTTCTVALDSSVDGISWSAGGVIAGQTCTSNGFSTLTTLQVNYTRINVTALTGGGTVTIGYQAGMAGGPGGSTVTVNGATPSGSPTSANPVLVGGLNVGAGTVHTISTDGAGNLGIGITNAGADGVSNALVFTPFNGNGPNYGYMGILPFFFNSVSWDRQFYCSNTSNFSVVSTVTQIVALLSGAKVHVCSLSLNPTTTTAGSVDVVYGTGTNCGTGTTTLSGAYTLPAAAVVSITPALSAAGALTTPAGQAVCVRTVTSTVAGFMTWAQY